MPEEQKTFSMDLTDQTDLAKKGYDQMQFGVLKGSWTATGRKSMCWFAIFSVLAAVNLPAEGNQKKVMAFYYTWYGNPEVSGAWLHWPEGGHDPEQTLPNGLPDTGTTNHPSLGLYDSMDPELMKTHLKMAAKAGVDVFICTWWRQKDRHDRVFEKLLDVAAETPVRLTVYYETIPEHKPERARDDLRYIVSMYSHHPAFFTYEDSPVIFIYGRAMGQIDRTDWEAIAKEFRQKGVFLIADSRKPIDGFLGTHVYNPVVTILKGTDMGAFYREDSEAAGLVDQIYAATIIPGYDDSNIGRKTPIVADREGGALYERQWKDALSADPDWIVITSWNELHEGSEIEPTHEDGTKYLDATTQWVTVFKDGRYLIIAQERETVAPGDSVDISVTCRAKGKLRLDVTPTQFELEELRTWDHGAMWQVGLPETVEPGEYTVEISGTVDAKPIPSADLTVQVVPPVTCSLEAVGTDDAARELGITYFVENNQNRRTVVRSDVVVTRWEEWHMVTHLDHVPARTRWRSFVPLNQEALKGLLFAEDKPHVRLVARAGKKACRSDKVRLPVALAVKAARRCACDGSLEEWKGLPFTSLDESLYRNRGLEEELDPITAKVITTWDEENFYVGVEVKDRIHHQSTQGFYVWQEDNVQIAFDPLIDGGAEYRRDDREFGLTLTPDGPEVWRWTPPLETGDESLKKVALGVTRGESLTTYEAAVPWRLIHEAIKPEAGTAFGFSVAINNASPDKPPGVLRLSEGIIFSKNPSKFPKWTLINEINQ